MTLLTTGRRALQYLGLAKNRLRALRRLPGRFVSQSALLPDGLLIVQRANGREKAIITTRDPYVVSAVRQRPETIAVYTTLYGGVTGESFLPEVPRTLLVGGQLYGGDCRYVPVGRKLALTVYMTQATATNPFTLYEDASMTHSTEVPRHIKTAFSVADYGHGIEQPIQEEYTVTASEVGIPVVDIIPIGESAPGEPGVMALAFEPTGTAGYYKHTIFLFSDLANAAAPTRVWPPASLNGGRPDLAVVITKPCPYARGHVIFVQDYIADWKAADDAIPVRAPDLVYLTNFGTDWIITPLATVIPAINTSAFKTMVNGALKITLGQGSAMVCTGFDHLVFLALSRDLTEQRIFTSSDGGGTWTDRGWPPGTTVFNELYRPYEEELDRTYDTLYSMQEGHVEFTTRYADGVTGDISYTVWTSMDHGATWTSTELGVIDSPSYETVTRGPICAAPMTVDATGQVTRYMKMNCEDKTAIVIDVFADLSFTDKLYSMPLPPGDYTIQSGDAPVYALPKLGFFGSDEFPAPIKPGFPDYLEYPA